MLQYCLLRRYRFLLRQHAQVIKRCYSGDIRNIGILAHIDAGKTTTTERMLFYAGKTRSLGEVHRGNTVTDYLAQERERGITICSSAVTFNWNGKRINLLDTPGHIDFTMEVEQSLYAVDGVIVVLDGTAGVEAQTVTVWTQADKHKLPRLVFVNKMDRPDANFEKCIVDLTEKLDAKPICTQYPTKSADGQLGIFDVITMEQMTWQQNDLGRNYSKVKLESSTELQEKRNELIDQLSGLDDELADVVISTESFDKVSNELIGQALRRATCQQKVVPVLLGSAYKNIGIQPLMDAVNAYLPMPEERNQMYDCFGNDFAGKVFKIVHDKQRGPLTLVRLLRGELKRGMRLLCSARGQAEVVSKIYEPLADEYREVGSMQAGDVAICAGLKSTVTGDLLTSSHTSLKNAQKRLLQSRGAAMPQDEDEVLDDASHELFSIEPKIPDAVYFCSIEPPSISSQTAMEQALKQLQREDPSLRVSYDSVTGQTVLGGMGELHMDIIKSRMLSEYKIDVDLGPLQIAYKETLGSSAITTLSVDKDIAGSKQSVSITLQLVSDQRELFSLDKSPENVQHLNALRPRILGVLRKGAVSALERGPRVGGQVVDTQIRLHNVTVGRGTADSFVMAAAAQCVQKLLITSGTRLLEPIMAIQIVAPNERISGIMADLSRRRALIRDVTSKGDRNKIILVNAPLAELSGYSSALRTISSGTASMTMQPCGFSEMNTADESLAVRRAQGLD
ncbi:ribosome-releasing factor 2, mitochondrial [Drosophila grimshawi]|uniref:Ribosome-releasing factor 2, mitochondrial n=1 Tax=Drosophila grimshawi TaxID=7222 RepID=RRF2M_DROGR|nr:ribosome-releasing factor 2, mitochondrial [Drosophila grimshawi]B4JSI3.1 RecName: Full=Ribosome-releasing factor 2, mitochondrial; Short=RRF2mt; AltName: Full=Elongation factor G 2, mitochondrial; Short=EF-G2mt; Short=mEF-G 2; Flags: Precursor [Drosophila grimshawi]EDV94723.1 GH22468 [Drosophila grimshawi]